MTTGTAPAISEEVLDERWHMATTELRQFVNESTPSECNSKVQDRLSDSIRDLAIRMVHEIRGGEEESALGDVGFDLMVAIKERVKQFAVEIETARAARKAAAA